MSKSTSKPRRRWRKVLVGLGALIVVLALLVGLAPRLMSLGVGRGAIAAALERHVNGTVSLAALKLRWFGRQQASGITVTGADGKTSAKVDLGVNAGLLALATGRVGTLEVDVSGTLSGEMRPDGSTSFANLLRRAEPGSAGGATPASPGGFVLPAGLPPTTVRFKNIGLALSDPRAPAMAVLRDVSGDLDFEPQGPIRLQLSGTTDGAGEPGSLKVALDAAGVFNGQGALALDRTSVNLDVTASHVPVLLADRPTEMTDFRLTAKSTALAASVAIGLDAEAEIGGAQPGRLQAQLVVQRPVSPDGALTLDPGRISGKVTGRDVPTALLQGTFAGTPVVVTRDIGPTFDVEADLAADQSGEVSVTVGTEAVNLEFAGVIDAQTRSIAGRVFKVSAEVSPQLVTAVTGLYPDRPAGVQIDVERLSIPPQDEAPRGQLAGTAFGGVLKLTAPVAIARQAGAEPLLTLDRLVARVNSDALGDRVQLGGSAAAEGVEAAFDVSLSGYLAEDGSLDLDRVAAEGSAALRGVSAATLARLLPQHRALIESAIEQPADVEMVASLAAGEPRVKITARNDGNSVAATVIRQGDALHVAEARADLTVKPKMIGALQEGAPTPFMPAEAVQVTAELEPFDVSADADALKLAGSARLQRVMTEEALGNARGELDLVRDDDGLGPRRADLKLTDVLVPGVEQVLGMEPGSLRNWLGTSGGASLSADLGPDASTATIGADFAKLKGELTASARGDVLSVDRGQATLELDRGLIQSRIDPPQAIAPAGGPGRQPSPPRMKVAADLPLSLEVRSLKVPRSILSGGRLDPAGVRVDVRLTGGPLLLDEAAGGRSTIDNLDIGLRGDDLTKGLGVTITGNVTAGGIREPGALDVTGKLTNLVNEKGAFTPRRAALQMTAKANAVPTAVVDALLDWQGLLAAAVGTRIDSFSAEANEFSRKTGTLQARIETPNGWLQASAQGRKNALWIPGTTPAEAELKITRPLCERILYRIHPLLGDIRTTRQPVKFRLNGAIIPLDGDISRLRGNLGITVGAVEFDSGSVTLALLRAFNATNKETLPGRIDPIKVKIRDGVVTYEQFAVQVEQYSILFSGTTDLVNRTMDLHWKMPLDGLTVSVTELKGKVEGIVVPLWTHGTFDKYKTDIDPDFKLEDVLLKAGMKTLLDQLFKNADQ